MGTGAFHADGQTDTTEPTVCFRIFTNAPKNDSECILLQDRNFILAVNYLDGREASQLQLGMSTGSLSHCEV